MQIITTTSDSTKGSITGNHAGQSHGFLFWRRYRCFTFCNAHHSLPWLQSTISDPSRIITENMPAAQILRCG
jgi:hypothetical protein